MSKEKYMVSLKAKSLMTNVDTEFFKFVFEAGTLWVARSLLQIQYLTVTLIIYCDAYINNIARLTLMPKML